MLRAIRGAIQVERDRADLVDEAARTLITTLMRWNGLAPDQLVSLLFTMTPDLHSAFPATAVRAAGLSDVPMMCATEIAVLGAMPRVIRLMAHVDTAMDRAEVRHPYLAGAARLRPDLAAGGPSRAGRQRLGGSGAGGQHDGDDEAALRAGVVARVGVGRCGVDPGGVHGDRSQAE